MRESVKGSEVVLWWTDVGESVEVPRDPVGSAFFERNRTVQMLSSQAVQVDGDPAGNSRLTPQPRCADISGLKDILFHIFIRSTKC